MGNKSTACMPICGSSGEKEGGDHMLNTRKYGKFKKPTDAKKHLKTMLEEEAYERQQEIKVSYADHSHGMLLCVELVTDRQLLFIP